jgi:hypothetical protein
MSAFLDVGKNSMMKSYRDPMKIQPELYLFSKKGL